MPTQASPSPVSIGRFRQGPLLYCSRRTATLSRVLPFALFMLFIGLEEIARTLAGEGFLVLPQTALYYLYPLKASSVAALLYLYRKEYRELSLRELTADKRWLATSVTAVTVFLLWISMTWTIPVTGEPAGFDPTLLPAGTVRVALIFCRVAGAVLVVPVMEELFWRSFLLRFLMAEEFQSVPVGRFTRSSFLVTTLLFGLEHHYIFAGMMAGAIYNLLLYRTRSLSHCVLAHAITNLALACYVLATGNWQFW